MRLYLKDDFQWLQVLSTDHIRRFHNVASARSFLRRLAGEPGNLFAIRDALATESGGMRALDDDDLVEHLAQRLVRCDLRLIACPNPITLTLTTPVSTEETTPLEDEQAAQPAPAADPAPAPAPAPAEEAVPADVDPVAQAEALRTAAEGATAFCEA